MYPVISSIYDRFHFHVWTFQKGHDHTVCIKTFLLRLCCFQFCIFQRFKWHLAAYEIPISNVEKLEEMTSIHVKKRLGLKTKIFPAWDSLLHLHLQPACWIEYGGVGHFLQQVIKSLSNAVEKSKWLWIKKKDNNWNMKTGEDWGWLTLWSYYWLIN